MKKIVISIIIILVIVILIIIGNINKNNLENNNKLKIVTSFYPIYIMTINITNGIEDIEVSNMAQNYSGCIHHYTLTTTDLKKFENADIYIENGYNMESFSNKIVETYPDINKIDTSKKIENIIKEDEEHINSHFWTSIENYINQVKEISERLKELDKKNALKYEENTNKYVAKLEKLDKEYKEALANIKGKNVVSLNESFSYLLNYISIQENLIVTDHENSALSAEQVKNIIDKMKNENIKSIIIGESDDEKNAMTIANETDAKIYKLNDCLSGDNTIDSYINTMKTNLDILKNLN